MPSGDVPASAIQDLVSELHRYEALLREAFACGGRLTAAMAAAQQEKGLSVTYGHKVFGMAASANVSVSAAISAAAETHRGLMAVARTLRMEGDGYGGGTPKPDYFFTGASDDGAPVVS